MNNVSPNILVKDALAWENFRETLRGRNTRSSYWYDLWPFDVGQESVFWITHRLMIKDALYEDH